jgi:hypothetical protein
MSSGESVGPSTPIAVPRLFIVGALALPIPLLEIRSPLVAAELGTSLRAVLLMVACGLAGGGSAGWVLRHRSSRLRAPLALGAGICWVTLAAISDDSVRVAGIVTGVALSGAASLLNIVDLDALSGKHYIGLAPVGGLALGLASGLGYLANSPSRHWAPVLAVAGTIAAIAALISMLLTRNIDAGEASHSGNLVVGPANRWRDRIASTHITSTHLAVAAAIGSTWGALPAARAVVVQEFQTREPTTLVVVLIGGVAAVAIAWGMQRRALSSKRPFSPAATLVPVSGLGLLCVAIGLGERWTLLWWIVALGSGGALLANSTSTAVVAHDGPVLSNRRREIALSEAWTCAAAGMVVGLCLTALAVGIESIDPRFVVGILCVPSVVLSVVLAGRGRTGANASLKVEPDPDV